MAARRPELCSWWRRHSRHGRRGDVRGGGVDSPRRRALAAQAGGGRRGRSGSRRAGGAGGAFAPLLLLALCVRLTPLFVAGLPTGGRGGTDRGAR
eukprot:scaffold685_cov324-Prasinococcus_capsulatus_cf.AAC.15